MTDHTPTPWQVGNWSGTRGAILAWDGGHCIRVAELCGSMSNPDIAKDADFIVKACNAHEAYEELDRAASYYIARLEDLHQGKSVRDLDEAESWYRTALEGLIKSASLTEQLSSADERGAT